MISVALSGDGLTLAVGALQENFGATGVSDTLEDVDAAFAHMVLQHVPSPAEAVAEMARVVRPGGRVVVVDFVEHDRDWMKEKLAVQWQGFPTETVRGWFGQAGLEDLSLEVIEPPAKSHDLPATFIAAGYKRAA